VVPSPNPGARNRLIERGRRLAIPLLFAALALAFVAPALVPGRTILPLDNLYEFPPWRAHAPDVGIDTPHNRLVSDAILQNYSWKRLARESLSRGELPLWNPYILSGEPFLAAAQNGALYPPGVLFYVLPLTYAYAPFLALHLWLAALGAYLLARALGADRAGATLAGLSFGFCGFLVVSFLWPMVVSTAAWLPWLLLVVEKSLSPSIPRLWRGLATAPMLAIAGAAIVTLQFLAGHMEMSLYLLLTSGLYCATRLIQLRTVWTSLIPLTAVLVGSLGAGVLLVPFAEAVSANVRTGWVDYAESVGYAHSRDRLIGYLLPDFFGNPTHHSYRDIGTGELRPIDHTRPDGERRTDTEWGGKNYVEGTVYVGILPLVATVLALIGRPRGPAVAIAAVGAIALGLAFGTPLYAALYYTVPGVNQLHTVFRWVYPASLCLAVLAGVGLSHGRGRAIVGALAIAGGLVGLASVGAAQLAPATAEDVMRRIMGRWPDMRAGLPEPRIALSYLIPQVVRLAFLLLATGGLLVLWRRLGQRLASSAATALLVVDLFSFGSGFYGSHDASLLERVPNSIRAIQTDPGTFRIVTYGEDDTLPSNTNMLFGLQDVRGYDTIILKDYVEYLTLIEPQTGIQYAKVAKLFNERSLDSPHLDALNVKYVLTSKRVNLPQWTLFFEGEGIRVYRNERAMPRAWVAEASIAVQDRRAALHGVSQPGFDPRATVVVETQERGSIGTRWAAAEVIEYAPNAITLRSTAAFGGTLVLADVYFPGWVVTVNGESAELLRANGIMRAVRLPAGEHIVRFEYRPVSLRVGGLLTFMGLLAGASLAVAAVWPAVTNLTRSDSPAVRILANSTFPIATSLLNKAIDVAFAIIVFRVLQAEGVGAYAFAGVIAGYFDILVGFGFGALITREVARAPDQAGRYLGSSTLIRVGLWGVTLAITALLTGPLATPMGITSALALALWLLALGVGPGIISGGVTALFMSRELMAYPAVVTMLTTAVRVSLGLVALALGWGFVGLAAVSVVSNVVTAVALVAIYVRVAGWPRMEFDPSFGLRLARHSVPLMLNELLNSIFFRIDAVLLKPLAGDRALGWYSTAYRFIDGFGIISSRVVLAIFPRLARQAHTDREAFARLYSLGARVLLSISMPIALATTALAEPIISVFAGASYLPEAAIALQILIWFLPLSFLNGLTQYVLIALDRQRAITVAFIVGATFNVAANLVLIPLYGYVAAAVVTVASELILLVPFWLAARALIPSFGLVATAWRLLVGLVLGAAALWFLSSHGPALAAIGSLAIFGIVSLVLGAFSREEVSTALRIVRARGSM
jgi:O-antigen/teichoic acid export membrane protein